MSRREARRHAFTAIFQMPFHGIASGGDVANDVQAFDELYTMYMDGQAEEGGLEDLTAKDKAFVERAAKGVCTRLSELDEAIAGLLKDWLFERVNWVDLGILRLSLYEMRCEPDIPPKVSINEAVELAKQYGTDESPAFVNGLLGVALKANPHA